MNLKGTPLRKSPKLVDFGRFRWFQTLIDPIFERLWDILTVPGPRWVTNNDIMQDQRDPDLSLTGSRISSPIRFTFWWKKCIGTVRCSLGIRETQGNWNSQKCHVLGPQNALPTGIRRHCPSEDGGGLPPVSRELCDSLLELGTNQQENRTVEVEGSIPLAERWVSLRELP